MLLVKIPVVRQENRAALTELDTRRDSNGLGVRVVCENHKCVGVCWDRRRRRRQGRQVGRLRSVHVRFHLDDVTCLFSKEKAAQ